VPEPRPLLDWGFDPSAEPDYTDAWAYYHDQRPSLASAFEEDFRRAVDFIRAYPEASPVVTQEDARKRLLRRFPYSICYTLEQGRVRIWAVAHHKKRPGYWHDRLRR
jgi:plasmid stabilization system protein ParE